MTQELKETIIKLKKSGLGYKAISKETGISLDTVKSIIKRSKEKECLGTCKCCGMKLKQTPGHRQKIFCSDTCRLKWWNTHSEQRNIKTYHEFKCLTCGKTFISLGNRIRKYCCKECYKKSSRKVVNND